MTTQVREENGQWVVDLPAGDRQRFQTCEEAEAVAALWDSQFPANHHVGFLHSTLELCRRAGFHPSIQLAMADVEEKLQKLKSPWRK